MAGATFGDFEASLLVAGAILVMTGCHFLRQPQHLVMLDMSLLVAGAAFGDVGLSLFVAGGSNIL